jgi:hypothetical protein
VAEYATTAPELTPNRSPLSSFSPSKPPWPLSSAFLMIEAGDDGEVGRGNRFGGLITPVP